MSEEPSLSIGASVYDDEGREVGTVRGFDEDGFFVATREGVAAMSVAHGHSVPTYGEAELMWRCSDCGAVGDIEDDPEGVPEGCPDCGAARERLYYWTED